jgi:RHS repeat-associated protein
VWLEERPSSLPADYFFTAKEFDPETGFYYFGARYLDPRFSKWLTADPGLGSYLNGAPNGGVHRPYNLSVYSYASNNPASAYDPDGRFLNLLVGGVSSVAIGYGIAKLTGEEYSWTQAGIDFGVGVATSGAGNIIKAVKVARALNRAREEVQAAGAAVRATESAVVGETAAAGESAAAKAGGVLGKVCGSFGETTPVTTSQGLKPIGDVKPGDRVLARSEATGEYAFEPVIQVFRHHDPVKVYVTLEDPATGSTEIIETTPLHLIHVPGYGFIPVAALEAGDPVSRALSDKPISSSRVAQLIADRNDMSDVLRVKSLTFEDQPFWAYNLEVAEDHTFFVGAYRAWVHNEGACALVADLTEKGLIKTYEEIGGHHIISKSIFKGLKGVMVKVEGKEVDAFKYLENEALTITEGGLKELGMTVEHTGVKGSLSTTARRNAWKAFGETTLTLEQAAKTEVDALVEGGMSRTTAEALVSKAQARLRDLMQKLGISESQLRIPYQ